MTKVKPFSKKEFRDFFSKPLPKPAESCWKESNGSTVKAKAPFVAIPKSPMYCTIEQVLDDARVVLVAQETFLLYNKKMREAFERLMKFAKFTQVKGLPKNQKEAAKFEVASKMENSLWLVCRETGVTAERVIMTVASLKKAERELLKARRKGRK